VIKQRSRNDAGISRIVNIIRVLVCSIWNKYSLWLINYAIMVAGMKPQNEKNRTQCSAVEFFIYIIKT